MLGRVDQRVLHNRAGTCRAAGWGQTGSLQPYSCPVLRSGTALLEWAVPILVEKDSTLNTWFLTALGWTEPEIFVFSLTLLFRRFGTESQKERTWPWHAVVTMIPQGADRPWGARQLVSSGCSQAQHQGLAGGVN